MASFRYRVAIPAKELDAHINHFGAEVLIFSKPTQEEVNVAVLRKKRGTKIIADICDDHLDWPHYRALLDLSDAVTCPTKVLADRLRWDAQIVPDPYEFAECLPHCNGDRVLWFGHGSNIKSVARVLPKIKSPIRIVSNVPGSIPWSVPTLQTELTQADIVILPATKDYKSPNRAVEAIRSGCFVVAEPHPALEDIPGIWIGDIPEGIEWAKQNQEEANHRTRLAQEYVRNNFSPDIQANAWRKVLRGLASTSDAAASNGLDGSGWTWLQQRMCSPT
jgi:hypothetical protein